MDSSRRATSASAIEASNGNKDDESEIGVQFALQHILSGK
jgi:hypothetical protein